MGYSLEKWRKALESVDPTLAKSITDEPGPDEWPPAWLADLLLTVSRSMESLRFGRRVAPKWIDLVIPALERLLEEARKHGGHIT